LGENREDRHLTCCIHHGLTEHGTPRTHSASRGKPLPLIPRESDRPGLPSLRRNNTGESGSVSPVPSSVLSLGEE